MQRNRSRDFFVLVTTDNQVFVFIYFFMLIIFDNQMTIMLYQLFGVILNSNIKVLFTMDKDLFFACFVFKSEFIKAAAAL